MAERRPSKGEPTPRLDDRELRERIERALEDTDADELEEKINPKKCGIGAFPMIEPTERR